MSRENCRYCPDEGLCSWCLREGMVEVERIIPEQLADELFHDHIVNTVFDMVDHRGGTREDALILCVKELVKCKNYLSKELTKQTFLQLPVIIYKDKP